jgi:hypothetical protein
MIKINIQTFNLMVFDNFKRNRYSHSKVIKKQQPWKKKVKKIKIYSNELIYMIYLKTYRWKSYDKSNIEKLKNIYKK